MGFKERLIEIAPRDTSGSRSASLFVYQQIWALCHLLELHRDDKDYVVTFDHHEDVSVLDAEEDPKEIRGYQIKTAQANWTLNSLLKREQGQGNTPAQLPSILGKMFDLKVKHPDEVKLLAFVSNQPTSVTLKADKKKHTDRERTTYNELTESDQQSLDSKLKLEHANLPLKATEVLEFRKSDLEPKTCETLAKGKLADFLEGLYPGKEFRIPALYKALLSEVATLNNNNEPITSYSDLLGKKSLSRRRFTEILTQVGVSPKSVTLDEIIQRLNSEQAPLGLVQAIRDEWDSVQLERLTARDIIHSQLWNEVKKSCEKHSDAETLVEFIDLTFQDVAPTLNPDSLFQSTYIKTCIAIGSYERTKSVDVGSEIEKEGPQ